MLRDISASYQFAIVDILLSKLRLAIDKTEIRVALIGGGVAANKLLREKADKETEDELRERFLLNSDAKFLAEDCIGVDATVSFKEVLLQVSNKVWLSGNGK